MGDKQTESQYQEQGKIPEAYFIGVLFEESVEGQSLELGLKETNI